MVSQKAKVSGDKTEDLMGRAQEVAERGYEIAKQAFDGTSEKIDDLSRFGRQRPLLAIGISFLAGFFVAKTFF